MTRARMSAIEFVLQASGPAQTWSRVASELLSPKVGSPPPLVTDCEVHIAHCGRWRDGGQADSGKR